MTQPGIVIVAHHDDLLSNSVVNSLLTQGINVIHSNPSTLNSLRVNMQDESFIVEDLEIFGILFRVSSDSNFSEGFVEEDRSFCDFEIKAAWLAALHLHSLKAVNRYNALSWFEGIHWPVWRRMLIEEGIPVSSFRFGDPLAKNPYSWYPYLSFNPRPVPSTATCKTLGAATTSNSQEQVNLFVCGEILFGKPNTAAIAAAELLEKEGVLIVEITTDLDQNILSVNSTPIIKDVEVVKRATHLIGDLFLAHLHDR